jgi:predicted permease
VYFLQKKKFSFDLVLKSPPVYAIIVSVLFLYFKIDTPLFLENTTFLLTYATIFLVLMSLGIALTRFKFSLKNSIILSLCRVVVGPIIAFIIIYCFELSGFAAGVLLIQSAMPSAILNYLVGSMHSPKKIVDSIASTIVVSTIMSFITIPIIVYIALSYFN